MLKRIVLAMLLVTSLSACIISVPHNPDGTINVPVLLDYAQYGIDADCKFGTGALAKDVCTFGMDTITLARNRTPSATKQFLQDAAKRQPKFGVYVQWLIDIL